MPSALSKVRKIRVALGLPTVRIDRSILITDMFGLFFIGVITLAFTFLFFTKAEPQKTNQAHITTRHFEPAHSEQRLMGKIMMSQWVEDRYNVCLEIEAESYETCWSDNKELFDKSQAFNVDYAFTYSMIFKNKLWVTIKGYP